MAGITDPLNDLPNLYALLDVVEIMIVDSFEKPEEREMYFTRTYAPPSGMSETATLPRGWDAESEMEAFEAAMDD